MIIPGDDGQTRRPPRGSASMETKKFPNLPAPKADFTVRLRFATVDRFKKEYESNIANGSVFIGTKRMKPKGARVQLIFVIVEKDNLEVWSWGEVVQAVTPAEAKESGGKPGLKVKLKDIDEDRKAEIEAMIDPKPVQEAAASARKISADSAEHPGYVRVKSQRVEVVQRVRKALERLKDDDYYAMLDLPRNASPEQIRAKYHEMSKEYHPDQYFRKVPPAMVDDLKAAFQKLNEVYRTLSKPDRKVAYDISIGNFTDPKVVRAAMSHERRFDAFSKGYRENMGERLDKAGEIYRVALAELEARRFKSARSNIKLALSFDPLNGIYRQKLLEVDKLVEEVKEQEAEEAKRVEAEQKQQRGTPTVLTEDQLTKMLASLEDD